MTEDAHKEISMDNNARIAVLEKQVGDLHRRFLEPSPSGEPPLADRINKAVRAYEQTSWLGKMGIWFLLTLGGLAGAGTAVITFIGKMGKQP